MASTSEKGHAKNVANFNSLITFCKGYGAKYNPSNQVLQVANLKLQFKGAEGQLDAVKTTEIAFIGKTNERQAAFLPLKPFCTRIINALIAATPGDLIIADARTINRKIQGKSIGKSKTATQPAGDTTDPQMPSPKTISNSQRSYDSLLDHYKKLKELVSQQAKYAPNEADLQAAALQTFQDNLNTSNTAVTDAYADWSTARIARDEALYTAPTGIVPTAASIKSYVKSIFTASSPQYKQISGIQFKVVNS